MGFTVAEGPEVENEWYNFEALNMPEHTLLVSTSDNFFLEGGGHASHPDLDGADPGHGEHGSTASAEDHFSRQGVST